MLYFLRDLCLKVLVGYYTKGFSPDYLPGPRRKTPMNVPAEERVPPQDRVPAEDGVPAEASVPAEDRLFSVRTEFVNRVSEPVLNQLLDKLLERHIINDDEMQSVRTKTTKADKVRDVIDMVRRKGTEASSVLIAALCEVDQCLSRELNFS